MRPASVILQKQICETQIYPEGSYRDLFLSSMGSDRNNSSISVFVHYQIRLNRNFFGSIIKAPTENERSNGLLRAALVCNYLSTLKQPLYIYIRDNQSQSLRANEVGGFLTKNFLSIPNIVSGGEVFLYEPEKNRSISLDQLAQKLLRSKSSTALNPTQRQ